MTEAEDLVRGRVQRVRERTVAQVVEKTPHRDGQRFGRRKAQMLRHLSRDPEDPERMLKSSVIRSGKDEVSKASLPDPPKSLEGGVADEVERGPFHGNNSVYRVKDRFSKRARTALRHSGPTYRGP